jgi:putative membrane protein
MKSDRSVRVLLTSICLSSWASISSLPTSAQMSPMPTTDSPSQTTPTSEQRSTNVSTADRQFATKAAQSDMTEIKTSQLALRKSKNPQVLSYAREMIQAHTDSTNKLKPIVARLNLTMPKTLGSENQALVNRLSRLSGTQFDREYTTGQAQGHAKTQAAFETELQQGQNSDLKAFANEILPVVTMHLEMVQKMTAMR